MAAPELAAVLSRSRIFGCQTGLYDRAIVVQAVEAVCGQRAVAESCGGSMASQGRARPPLLTSSEKISRLPLS